MVTFSARPPENSDPWYATREAYDQSLENGIKSALQHRGVTALARNFDEYFTPEYMGIWTIRQNFLTGGPLPGATANYLWTIEVLGNSVNSIKQIATSTAGEFYRTKIDNTNWGPWIKRPKAPIISENPFEPIANGDVLYAVDPFYSATDLATYPVGFFGYFSSPEGWLKNDTVLLGGRGVKRVGSGPGVLHWNNYVREENVELTARVAILSLGNSQSGGLAIRAQGGSGTQSHYSIYLADVSGDTQLILGRHLSGSYARLASVSLPGLASSTPTMIKLSVSGSNIRAKAWLDGEREPEGWMIGIINTEITGEGRFGLYHNSGAVAAWDQLQVVVNP